MSNITPEMFLTILDRPIAYHRIYATITGSVTAAVMLSQAMYWTPRTNDLDRWFYKTSVEWEKETGLSRREQETARRILKDLAILEEKKQGLPCKLFFKIDLEKLYSCIIESAKPDTTKPTNKHGENRQTGYAQTAELDDTKQPNNLYTETTTETTTDITSRKNKKTSQPDLQIFINVFNSDAPKDWLRQKTIDSFTTKELLRFVGEFEDDSAEIFQNGLLGAQKDSFWSKKEMSLKWFLVENRAFEFAQKYQNRSPEKCSADRQSEVDRLMNLIGAQS